MKLKIAKRFLNRNSKRMYEHNKKIKKQPPGFLIRWKEATRTIIKNLDEQGGGNPWKKK